MKKTIIAICTALLSMTSIMSCQDELEEQYTNPEETSEASIGKFFTKMLNNDRVRPSYWNVRTFLVMHPAVYTQSVSFTNANRRYMQQLNYLDDYWRDYYTPTGSGIVAHLREMEKTYAALSGNDQVRSDPFMNAAYIVYYDQTAQMVDLWGDIPFSQAGSLNLSGAAAAPGFDGAQEIYNTLLEELENKAAYFSNAQLESTTAAAFAKQDILFSGNLDKWRRYANSLRLRLLMRISFSDEAKASADVMEMLSDPSSYPLVDEPSHNVLLAPLTTYNDNMRNALTELSSHVAPPFLLDEILKPADDPRIRAWFDKGVRNVGGNLTANEDYFSMPDDISSSQQEADISAGKYAVLDSATFLFNPAFPGIIMTSAEVEFLKAEAFQRWGSTEDAKAAYEEGVTDAVNFLFFLNASGTGKKADPVSQEELDNLLAAPSVAYTGTNEELLTKIWTQKWLSFGFMQSVQSWAEMRRTNTPALTFLADNSTPGSELPPSRLLYPNSEVTYNPVNYAKVAAQDLPNIKIFWDVN